MLSGLTARSRAATVSMAPRLLPRLAARLYHENIVDHYESPRNVGSMDKADPRVGTGLVGAPACGDVMKLQLRVGVDGTVEEAVFKVTLPLHTAAATSHNEHSQHAVIMCIADVWLWISYCQLFIHHRMAQGQVARRGCEHQK